MSEVKKNSAEFIGYEYKELNAEGERAAFCLDCYECFGWKPDERAGESGTRGKLLLKRERKIVNKAELTRLQRHFESCMEEIAALERSKTANASLWAIVVGIIGTAFLTGATFAATHSPPFYGLCTALAIPGFIGWTLPWFLYQKLKAKRTQVVTQLVEQKFDEIYEICKQGNKLLN